MITYYVNRASSAGGTGTTNATTGANRAFVHLNEAATVLAALNAADDVTIFCCGIAADDSYPDLTGTYVQPGFSLYIRGNPTDPNGAHSGYYNAYKYRLTNGGANEGIRIAPATGQRIVLSKIQGVVITAGSLAVHIQPSSAASMTRIEKCIFVVSGVTAHDAIWARSAVPGYGVQIINCAFSPLGAAGMIAQGWILSGDFGATGNGPLIQVRNCVVRGGLNIASGILRYQGTVTLKNCAVFDNWDDFNEVATPGALIIDYCASDDGDGTNPIAVPSWPAQFVNPNYGTVGDFRLKVGSVLLGAGVGPAVDPIVPTDDIVNVPRAGLTASVGPFEREASFSQSRLDYRFLRTEPSLGLVDAGDGLHSVQAP